MLKNDYMKEVENSLKIVKKEVDKSIANNEIDRAFQLINKELKSLVGLDFNTIDSLAFSSVKTMVSRDNQYNSEKYVALSEILSLQGNVLERTGDEGGKIFYYTKALDSFIEAYSEDDGTDKKYLKDAENLVNSLGEYELTVKEEKNRLLIYELLGQYDNAEDILFDLLKSVEDKEDIKKFGIEFYNRLKEKTAEELENGNLPLEEVEDGLKQVTNI